MKIDLLCQYSQENHQKMFENARRHAFLDILVDFFIPKWLKNVPKCMRACIFLIFGSTYCDQPSLWPYLYCAVWKYEVKPKCTTQSLCFIWLVWLALLLFPNSFKSREVFVKRSRILPARADAEWGWFRSPPFPNLFKSNPLFKSRSRFLFDDSVSDSDSAEEEKSSAESATVWFKILLLFFFWSPNLSVDDDDPPIKTWFFVFRFSFAPFSKSLISGKSSRESELDIFWISFAPFSKSLISGKSFRESELDIFFFDVQFETLKFYQTLYFLMFSFKHWNFFHWKTFWI